MLTRGLLHFCFWAKVLLFKKGWGKKKKKNQKENNKTKTLPILSQVCFAGGHLMQASAGGCVNIK